MERVEKWFTKYNKILLLLFVVVLSVLYATLSILRHMHFESGGFDLGLYDQAAWRFANFLPLYNTVKERVIFGDHLVLTLPLVSFLFYLWNDVRALLIFQAIAIASSAIPIFLVAKKRLGMQSIAWVVTILYSLFYGIQFGVFFDFHPIIFGVAILSYLVYALEYGKKKLFVILFILALLTQENMGIAIGCLGFIYFFRKEFRKQALIMILVGFPVSLAASKIIALFSPVGFQYTPSFPMNPIIFVERLFDTPEKRQVWLYSYGWFSFLPLFSLGSVMAVVTDLSQYFVSGSAFIQMWTPFKHHRAIFSLFLTLGLLDVLVYVVRIPKYGKRLIMFIGICLLIVAGFFQYHEHFALNKLVKKDYWKEEQWMRDARTLFSEIPNDASVATQQNFVPHLSHRKEIYLVWPRLHDIQEEPCGQSLCWWLDFGGNPEYLVVDTRPDQWLTQILESNENWLSAISNMEKVGKITLEKQVGGVRIYKIMNKEL